MWYIFSWQKLTWINLLLRTSTGLLPIHPCSQPYPNSIPHWSCSLALAVATETMPPRRLENRKMEEHTDIDYGPKMFPCQWNSVNWFSDMRAMRQSDFRIFKGEELPGQFLLAYLHVWISIKSRHMKPKQTCLVLGFFSCSWNDTIFVDPRAESLSPPRGEGLHTHCITHRAGLCVAKLSLFLTAAGEWSDRGKALGNTSPRLGGSNTSVIWHFSEWTDEGTRNPIYSKNVPLLFSSLRNLPKICISFVIF